MNLRLMGMLFLTGICSIPLFAQQVQICITNPSSVVRTNEPVVVRWDSLSSHFPGADFAKLRLIDEQGRSMAFQLDDMDFDHRPDEFVFTATLLPSQERRVTLTLSADTLAAPSGPLRTDAANWKKVKGVPVALDDDDGPGTLRGQGGYLFDGVGWESELIGYRLYLDERNAVDIEGKRQPGLHWNYIGTSGTDYQRDAYWGMDILHIGPALGVGGIGFWVGDSLVRPFAVDRRRCRIVSRGPVRAVVAVDYDGWDTGGGKIDLTSRFIIYAGDRMTEHEVILRDGRAPGPVAAGIVRHRNASTVWNEREGSLYTVGRQSRANDSLMLALSVRPADLVKRHTDPSNEFLLLHLATANPLRFSISAFWQGEQGIMWDAAAITQYLHAVALRNNEPLIIHVGQG